MKTKFKCWKEKEQKESTERRIEKYEVRDQVDDRAVGPTY